MMLNDKGIYIGVGSGCNNGLFEDNATLKEMGVDSEYIRGPIRFSFSMKNTVEDVEIATLSGNTKQSEGTSYSAARITAEAAKLLQKNPDLTAAQLREKLLGSAQSLPDGRKYIPK